MVPPYKLIYSSDGMEPVWIEDFSGRMMLCSILGVIWPICIMEHDFSKVFDTDNPLWQEVLAIFEANKDFPAKRIKGRALHHKFPRSFSKLFSEPEDNDPDNLISLTPAQHFMVHYYYFVVARPDYAWKMAIPFRCMMKRRSLHLHEISPEIATKLSIEYERAKEAAAPHMAEIGRNTVLTEEGRERLRKSGRKVMTPEHIKKMREARGPITEETRKKLSIAFTGRKYSEETKAKMKENWYIWHSTPYVPTEEVRRKHSEAMKGIKKSPEHCKHISEGRKGIKFSDEHKRHLKEAINKRVLTPEIRYKMGANRGRHYVMSDEHKEKLRQARLGMKFSDEARLHMSLAKKGKPHGPMREETKRKLSEAHKGKPGHPMSEEQKKMRSNMYKGKHWKLIDGKRAWVD